MGLRARRGGRTGGGGGGCWQGWGVRDAAVATLEVGGQAGVEVWRHQGIRALSEYGM